MGLLVGCDSRERSSSTLARTGTGGKSRSHGYARNVKHVLYRILREVPPCPSLDSSLLPSHVPALPSPHTLTSVPPIVLSHVMVLILFTSWFTWAFGQFPPFFFPVVGPFTPLTNFFR